MNEMTTPASAGIRQDFGGAQRGEAIARLAEELFDEPVIRITAPGGRSRDSVRVHFDGWTAIASVRSKPARLEREAAFLTRMTGSGAPVPKLLDVAEGVLFQTDLGSTRLTAELMRREGAAREALVEEVFESLWQIKDLVWSTGFLQEVRPIATAQVWLERFASQPRHIAANFGLPAPAFDSEAFARKLRVPAGTFVKWDARPGNAALDSDGRVHWFDWEDYGRRGGIEDFAFLIGDEFWPVDVDTSLRLFAATNRMANDGTVQQLARFAMLCAAQRLRYMRDQWNEHGWISEGLARRYDRIGGSEGLIAPICDRAAALADLDPVSRPLAEWFRSLADPDLWQKPEADAPPPPN